MNQIPHVQMPPYLTALRCFFLVAMHHGIQVAPEKLSSASETDVLASIMRLMREVGLSGKVLDNCAWEQLSEMGSAFPLMAQLKDGGWVIVASVMPGAEGKIVAAVLNPTTEQNGISLLDRDQFEQIWAGRIILTKRKLFVSTEPQKFGFRWFMPEILRNRSYFRDIAIATMMSHLIAIATPLLFQIIIDKVIPHQSYQTLYAVILAFVIAMTFDAIFAYMRQHLMIFASNKIDARLAARSFEHLLRLPLQFFETHPTGVLLRHMQQTETVRGFLTGRLFQTILDAAALPFLLIGLTLYSGALTFVVFGFAVAIASVIGIMVPTFRHYLQLLYAAEGARQADLVETIHGMRAVKSLALESLRMKSWDEKVAGSIRRRATVGYFGAVAMVLTTTLQGAMQMSILGIGATMVFDGSLSMGALIAFNMLSGRVTGPLVQIVGLINEYQSTSLAVKMLGTVMDHPPERDINQRGVRPHITGQLEFTQVNFRYPGASTPALNNVSFTIEEGQMIGVVGRSGSGKTTLTRLVQGICTAQEGLLRMNGVDIRNIDLPHLRRSIGVVLQDNILFRGTIRDNIAAGKPDATLEEVMEAARLAGASEFIDRLPMSYETMVEESASNYSGGQRQRIAIARALILRPRLMLLDEATSALDPESEAIVQQNLSEIARGRTMIVVSHRLSSLVNADAIMVMDRGQIVDFAPHATLVERCDIYRLLWDQQTRHMQ